MSLCERWIEVLKNETGFDSNRLNSILKIHNYEYTFECMVATSRYYDELQWYDNTDEKFLLRLQNQYGYTAEYWEGFDENIGSKYENNKQ